MGDDVESPVPEEPPPEAPVPVARVPREIVNADRPSISVTDADRPPRFFSADV
jgi:hypothetical protein